MMGWIKGMGKPCKGWSEFQVANGQQGAALEALRQKQITAERGPQAFLSRRWTIYVQPVYREVARRVLSQAGIDYEE